MSPLEGFVKPPRRVADSLNNDKPPFSDAQRDCPNVIAQSIYVFSYFLQLACSTELCRVMLLQYFVCYAVEIML